MQGTIAPIACLVATTTMSVACGCSGGEATPAPASPAAVVATASPQTPLVETPPRPEPIMDVRVFVDTSGSMRGFFGRPTGAARSSQAVLAVFSELTTALTEASLGSPEICTVGRTVSCEDVPQTVTDLARAQRFGEAESRLDLVLKREPLPERIDPNAPPPMDHFDEARVTVMITDGMQAATPGNADESLCAHGADPACVRSLILERIADGYGLWLVGVLLPFNGTHYTERALADAYFDQTVAHVDELRFDERNLGVTFRARNMRTGGGGTASYTYEGYKPLLVLVFSRDPVLGRHVVDLTVDKLRGAPIQPGKMAANDTVRWVELSPLLPATVAAREVVLPPLAEQQGIDPSEFAEFRLEGSQTFDGGLSSKVWCGSNGKGLLYVDYDRTPALDWPDWLQEDVVLVQPPGTDNVVAPPAMAGSGRLRTGVNCTLLVAGHSKLTLPLQTGLRFDEEAAADEWWSRADWSSNDTWKKPERLYGLEELILPILRERVSRPARWGEVVIHVDRN